MLASISGKQYTKKKTLTLLFIKLFCSLQIAAQGTNEDFECPPHNQEDINELCVRIYEKEIAEDDTELSYTY